jgi:hypothetical protein
MKMEWKVYSAYDFNENSFEKNSIKTTIDKRGRLYIPKRVRQ